MKGLSPERKLQIANEVKSARAANGWTQADLARQAGVKQQAIAQIETGGSYSLAILLAAGDALGIGFVFSEDDEGVHPTLPIHTVPVDKVTLRSIEQFVGKARITDILKISDACVKELQKRHVT
ncbi:MAG: helix-turn-helix domain-containing protein [Verrucomicrobia bacterium]|nr:helix-turn-helix domain-containing protein [Verrucomicrobiota bacterium]